MAVYSFNGKILKYVNYATLILTVKYTVTTIQDDAFTLSDSHLHLLKRLNFEAGSRLQKIPQFCFRECTSLREVDLSNCKLLKTITEYAFYQCPSLINIKLPSSIEVIDKSSFCECYLLESFILPENLITIGSYAFYKCTSLVSLSFPKDFKSTKFTNILSYAFSYCVSLEYIPLSSITTIEAGAFSSCISLLSISLENIKELYKSAFLKCYSLQNVSMFGSLVNISSYAFSNCVSLKNIILPNSLTNIFSYAFYNCTSLSKITFPSPLVFIDNYAFSDCISLESVLIQENLPNLDSKSFYNCNKLTSITISDSNPYITADDFVLYNKNKTCIFFCLIGKTGFYKVPPEVKQINFKSFAKSSLSSILMAGNENIISLPSLCFSKSLLQRISLPKYCEFIESDTFGKCYNLKKLSSQKLHH